MLCSGVMAKLKGSAQDGKQLSLTYTTLSVLSCTVLAL